MTPGSVLRALVGLSVAALVLTGCEAQLEAAGEPGDTQVIVGRSSAGLTVEAPEWRPPETLVYLCPVAPTRTATSMFDAGTIVLPASCRSFGRVDSSRGLTTTLGFGELDATARPIFAAAPDWYLVLIGLRNGTADRVYRTAVQPIAIDPSITPGPAEPGATASAST